MDLKKSSILPTSKFTKSSSNSTLSNAKAGNPPSTITQAANYYNAPNKSLSNNINKTMPDKPATLNKRPLHATSASNLNDTNHRQATVSSAQKANSNNKIIRSGSNNTIIPKTIIPQKQIHYGKAKADDSQQLFSKEKLKSEPAEKSESKESGAKQNQSRLLDEFSNSVDKFMRFKQLQQLHRDLQNKPKKTETEESRLTEVEKDTLITAEKHELLKEALAMYNLLCNLNNVQPISQQLTDVETELRKLRQQLVIIKNPST